jgi:hypothetical protein
MLFMIIERFQDNDMVPVYRRVREAGRMLPACQTAWNVGSSALSVLVEGIGR